MNLKAQKKSKEELCNFPCFTKLSIFTNTVLWTSEKVDLKTMAIDCQEDNLRIPLRVGSLMRP